MAPTHLSKMRRWHTLDDMLAPERNSFGIIRLAMALCVLVSHCFFLAAGSSQQEPLAWTGYTLGDDLAPDRCSFIDRVRSGYGLCLTVLQTRLV